jgi:hypothetical protein
MKVRSIAVVAIVATTLLAQPMAASFAESSSKSSTKAKQETEKSHGSRSHGYTPTKNAESSNSSRGGVTTTPDPVDPYGIGPVTYQPGGSVILKPRVYVIWYGNWDKQSCSAEDKGTSTASILMNLTKHIGDSAWNAINTTYYQIVNGKKQFISSGIEYSGCVVDTGSLGLSLQVPSALFAGDPNDLRPFVADVVDTQLQSGKLKTDASGVYLVLTATNVQVDGFNSNFCGFHDYYSLPTIDIKYAHIGDPTPNMAPGGCVSQPTVSPNKNPAADAMASVLAHELIEPISDPLFDAWFDQGGWENADKCAYRYGTVTMAADGSFSNMKIGDRPYLIQQNVAANTNVCVSSVSRS